MADTPDDIIELTDIIEHGPGARKTEAGEGDVDLSFERELEDLFAEGPEGKPSDAGGIPDLEGLHLPEEESKDEGGIDLDGLDALLADAEKSDAGKGPELADDFFEQATASLDRQPDDLDVAAASPAGAAVAARDEVSGEALEGVTSRLELLEEKISVMGDALQASFKSLLDDALSAFKAEMPAQQPAPDMGPAIEELRHSLEERVESLRAELPKPVDEQALAEAVKQEVLANLPEPGLGEEAVDARIEAKLEAFQTELPDQVTQQVLAALPQAGAGLDVEAVDARVESKLEDLKAELSPAPPSSGLDEPDLVERLKEEVLASLPQPAAPDLSGLASIQALESLRTELLAEIEKAVPAVAARIIREEIQALAQEMD